MLTLGQVQDKLGIKLPGEFIEQTLGIAPEAKEKRSLQFGDSQFNTICEELIKYTHGVMTGTRTTAVKEKAPRKGKNAAAAESLDDLF